MKTLEIQDAGRFPLLVTLGISGHRKPEQLGDLGRLNELLKQEIRRVRDHLRAQNGEVTFLVLSPLADGADRIFARAVWDVDPEARLVVPLPFDKEAYEASFFDGDSIKEFNQMLDHPNCLEHFVVPGGRRDEYLEVGKYVVDHADVMFYLHDGSDYLQAPMDGGTSSVLHYARFTSSQNVPGSSGDNDQAGGAPGRRPGVYIETLAGKAKVFLPDQDEPVAPEAVDPAVFNNPHASYLDDMKPFLPWSEGRQALTRRLGQVHTDHFDMPAGKFQRRFDTQSTLIIAMAFLIGSNVLLDWATGGNKFFDVLGGFKNLINWDSICLMSLLVLLGTVFYSRKGTWLRRWVDVRYLAEATRHADDLLLAGVPLSTIIHHARREPVPLSLCRVWHSIYLQAHLGYHQQGSPPISAGEIRDRLLHEEGLILDQLVWHRERARQKWRTEARYTLARNICFFLSGGAAAGASYLVIAGWEDVSLGVFTWSTWLDVMSSSASLALAGVAAMAAVKEHGKMASRYQVVSRLLDHLYRHVTFTSQGNEAFQQDALRGSVLEAARILRLATHSWIHTMQSKDPDYS